jgi:hypothetical protein
MGSAGLASFGMGGWFGLGFGRISMPIIVTTTNAANVTAKDERVHARIQKRYLRTARRMFSHLISSTTVRRSLMATIALFNNS